MALPFPSIAFTPFDILRAEELNQMVQNDQALAAGTGLNDGSIDPIKFMLSAFERTTVAPSSGSGIWDKYDLGAFTVFVGTRTVTIGTWSGSAIFTDVNISVPTGESTGDLNLISTTYSSTSGNLSMYPSSNSNWNGTTTVPGIRYAAATATNFSLGARYVYIKKKV